MKNEGNEVWFTLMIPLEADDDGTVKINWREDYIGVIPQTLQEKMTTIRWRQHEWNKDNIQNMKTPNTTSLPGQGGYHANLRGCRRWWWWNEDAAITCQLEEEDGEKEEMEMLQ